MRECWLCGTTVNLHRHHVFFGTANRKKSDNAGKLASIKEVNKTDLSKWAYQRYRQLQLMHEHARSIWRIGEDFAKYLMKGDRK